MDNFLDFDLPEQLTAALTALNFTAPTPIQAQVIPPALLGKDILASAQTGTGKTAAFGIPLINKLLLDPQAAALVMTPTRELAAQVIAMLNSLINKKHGNIRTALLIGGESMPKQLQQLKAKPRLVVGTPGRINDHLMRGTLKLHSTNFLVLDETDRMLDMGFTPQIDRIIPLLQKNRQTLLLSATLPKNIMAMAERYLNDPVRIAVAPTATSLAGLKQEVVYVDEQDKQEQLAQQLHQREGSVIIFVKTKMGAERMAKQLRLKDHSADAIHGDLSHNKREMTIKAFRDSKYRIMVATDIAARGLDIAHVKHVINYDLPQCPEDYIHRIGRTARAGAEGSALCFVTPSDRGKWKIINRLINPGLASSESEAPKGERRPRSDRRDRDDRGDRRGGAPRRSGGRPFRGGNDKAEDRGNRQARDGEVRRPAAARFKKIRKTA